MMAAEMRDCVLDNRTSATRRQQDAPLYSLSGVRRLRTVVDRDVAFEYSSPAKPSSERRI